MERAPIHLSPDDLGFLRQMTGKSERLADRIHDNLLHAIVTGRLPLGARLPSEVALSTEFEVSRPVLREALDRLRDAGLIASVRGSGNFIQDVSLAVLSGIGANSEQETMERVGDLLDGLELRMIVEPMAAELAARRRRAVDLDRMRAALDGLLAARRSGAILHHHDYAFHEAIARATGNERIVQTLKSLEYDVARSIGLMWLLARRQPEERLEAGATEHEAIFAAIEAGAATEARRAMRNHLEHTRIRMVSTRPG